MELAGKEVSNMATNNMELADDMEMIITYTYKDNHKDTLHIKKEDNQYLTNKEVNVINSKRAKLIKAWMKNCMELDKLL